MSSARLKKIHYQSWHRGTKENDLILGRFADEFLEKLSPEELDDFETLLFLPDDVLFKHIVSQDSNSSTTIQSKVLEMIKNFHHLCHTIKDDTKTTS